MSEDADQRLVVQSLDPLHFLSLELIRWIAIDQITDPTINIEKGLGFGNSLSLIAK